MSRDSQDGVLGRWSRRKVKARAGDPDHDLLDNDPKDAGGDSQLPKTEDSPEDDRPDSEILEDLGLPDPDTLQEGDDFKGFLRREVPARLRRRALARLWRSHPLLATVDDLVEYGEDYTDAATVVENLQTVYQVGRGMLVPEPEPSTTADTPAVTAEVDEGTTDDDGSAASSQGYSNQPAIGEDASDAGTGETVETADLALPDAQPASPAVHDDSPRPRRESMQFRFDDE